MASPAQFGSFRFNAWSILRNLTNNFVGILTLTVPPTSGVAGSFAGKAGPGTVVIDITTGIWYTNIGTKTIPIWSTGGAIAALAGQGSVGNAKMSYSFAVNGGAISTIVPANSPVIPLRAIILGGVIDITTTLVGAGASIGLGLGSAAQVAVLKAPTVVASWTAGLALPLIELFTAATYYKAVAAEPISLTISGGALTAGAFNVNLVYVRGNP